MLVDVSKILYTFLKKVELVVFNIALYASLMQGFLISSVTQLPETSFLTGTNPVKTPGLPKPDVGSSELQLFVVEGPG